VLCFYPVSLTQSRLLSFHSELRTRNFFVFSLIPHHPERSIWQNRRRQFALSFSPNLPSPFCHIFPHLQQHTLFVQKIPRNLVQNRHFSANLVIGGKHARVLPRTPSRRQKPGIFPARPCQQKRAHGLTMHPLFSVLLGVTQSSVRLFLLRCTSYFESSFTQHLALRTLFIPSSPASRRAGGSSDEWVYPQTDMPHESDFRESVYR
jgi:hypothetical protein